MKPVIIRRALAALAVVLTVVAGCRDGALTGPDRIPPGSGRLSVVAAFGNSTATNLVIEVTAPDIAQPLVFNLAVTNGTATGSVTIPAGANRLITVRAFDGKTETHRGSRSVTIVEGVNPALTLTLLPLAGTVPVTVSFGVAIVTVTPATWANRVGDTARFAATVMDATGAMQTNAIIRWASTDTRRLTIDSTGLATSRDTGTVMVVAVAGGAAGRGSVTITPGDTLAQPTYTRTWVGGATGGQTAWTNPNNWSPSAVPTQNDSVVIGAATFQPSLPSVDTLQVRDLTLLPGANLNLSFRTLTIVGGTLSGLGGAVNPSFGGTLRLVGNARLRGNVSAAILVQGGGTVTLADSARVTSLEIAGTSTVFDPAGRRLVLTAPGTALNVGSGGLLRMDAAADTLDVVGQIYLQASAATHAGNLTAGTLIVRSSIQDGTRFEASGTHRTVFNGAVANVPTQSVNGFDANARPGNTLQDVVVSGTSAWSNCSSRLRVRGSFTVSSPVLVTSCTSNQMDIDGPLSTVAGSTLGGYSVVIGDTTGTTGVTGAVTTEYLTFRALNPRLRAGLAYRALSFQRSVSITDSIRTTGVVNADGTGTVIDIATPAGRAATFAELTLTNGAALAMAQASDSLVVSGGLTASNSADLSQTLTAGTLRIGGGINGPSFGAGGSHLTVLDGASATVWQDIGGMDFNSRPNNVFRNLTIANTGIGTRSCFSNVRVTGALRLVGSATYSTCSSNYTRVDSLLATSAGSSVTAYGFTLANGNGTQDVLGAWTPEFTDFIVPNQPVRPSLGYRNLRFFASNTIPAGLTAATSILVDGATTMLSLPDGRITTGAFGTQNGARFTMTPGDTLRVTGGVNLVGGSSTPSGGVLEIESSFNGSGYAPSGTHELRLRGAGAHALSGFSDRPLPTLRIVSGTAQINFMNLVVQDSLLMAAGTGIATATSNFVTVRGRLQTATGSSMTPYGVALEGTATLQSVDGGFSPTILRVVGPGTGPGTSLRNGANILYNNVEFYTSYALSDSLSVSGYVYASGAGVVLDLNGRKLRAPAGLNFDNNAAGRLVNAADTLIVGNGSNATSSLLWDSGTSGTVSAGTIFVLGGSTAMSSFVATGTNRVIYTDTGFAAAARTAAISGSPTFRRLIIRGQPQFTVSQNFSTLAVTDSLRIESGTLQLNSSTAVVDGGGQAVLVMGSAAALTAVGSGTIELASATGTGLVAAGATFSPTLVRFRANSPTVNPALAYQNVEFYGPVTFSGNTNISGNLSAQNTGAGVTLNGRRINVGGYVDMNTNAYLVMSNAADTLDVGGDLYVDGGVASTLTDGVILFRGSTLAGNNFAASGQHRTVFLGASGAPQTVNGNTTFQRLEVAGSRGFNANFSTYTVNDTLRVTTAVPLTGPGTIVVNGPLVASSPIAVSVGTLRLRHASGTANLQPGTTFSSGTLYLSEATGQPTILRRGLAYNSVAIEAPVTLDSAVTIGGNLVVGNGLNPRLTLNGNAITVAGQVDVTGGGRLYMTNAADLLRTTGTGYVYIQPSADSGQLSAGTIEVSGDYYTYSTKHITSGSHRVLLTRSDTRTQIIQQQSGVPIANLEIAGTGARTITFQAAQLVQGSFRVTSPAAVTINQNAAHALEVVGTMAAPSTTTWSLAGTLTVRAAAGIDSLLGSVSLGNGGTGGLAIGGFQVNQNIPTAARYSIANLTVRDSASATIGSGTRLIGVGTPGSITTGTISVGAFGSLSIPAGSTLKACSSGNGGLAGPSTASINGSGNLRLRLPGPLGSTSYTGFLATGIIVTYSETTGC